MQGHVILLNADYTLLNAISWKRALCLMVKGKVDVVEETGSQIGPYFLPRILRLIERVKSIYKRKTDWSKRNVMLRDRFSCQYCGCNGKTSPLTIDHVLPRSRGGRNSWENTVTACFACNNHKGGRTPDEAKMVLISRPYRPSLYDLILNRLDTRFDPEALAWAAPLR
jgi:5-methylcytosine-specific restriction endonuclease McrA